MAIHPTDSETNWFMLLAAARKAAEAAYCPYSGYAVGAALQTADGRVFTGCNVENASYGMTLCAERVAVVSAVAAGAREGAALALAAGEARPASPCGACLQVLAEFCPPEMAIVCTTLTPVAQHADASEAPLCTTLGTLLPSQFRLSHQKR